MKLKNGELLNGDCLELMKAVPADSVDMILCDLPYGTTQNKWDSVIPFDKLWEQYWRIAKPTTPIVLTAQCPFDKALGMSAIDHLKYEWIWEKSRGTGHLNAKRQPMKNAENILVFYKKQCVYNPQGLVDKNVFIKNDSPTSSNYGKQDKPYIRTHTGYPHTIISFASETGIHPTQKPVTLFEYLIRTYTNPGDLVMDNCSGSGTTAIAAENVGRRWLCMEQDPVYFMSSMNRIISHHV